MGKTRPWKTAKTGAASSTINVSKCGSGLKPSWDQRMKERAARAAVQAAQREVDEQIRQEKREIRERREEKQRRKEENRAKGTSFQVVRRAHLARPRRRGRCSRHRTRGRLFTARGCSQPAAACSQPAAARPQITNTAKLKRMSKKQLKMVRKADTSGVAPKDVARQAIFPKIGGKPGKGRR